MSSESNAAVVPVVEAPVAALPVAIQRTIQAVADAGVRLVPAYCIHKTFSETFRCLTPGADEKLNWKKGLVYFIARYSKGVNFELWMYSTKGGAHLAEYKDMIRPLAVGATKCEPCGQALKLRLQIADAMKDEDIDAAILEFMTRNEPVLAAIREKIVVHVSEKKTVAPAPAAPVTEVVPVVEPAPEAPAPEAPAPAEAAAPAVEPVVSKRQAKKAAKRAAAAK